MRMMLDSHPAVAIPPETWFVPYVIAAFERGPLSADEVVEEVVRHSSWDDFGLDPAQLRERLESHGTLDAATALRAFYEIWAARAGKPRWGDKTPTYVTEMVRVQAVLPEARFVHLIRDGRDVVLSLRGVGLLPGGPAELARAWKRSVRRARRQAASLHGYLEVRYEELVRSPEPTLRRVCELLELPWEPGMLQFHRTAAERMEREVGRDLAPAEGGLVIPAAARRRAHALVAQPLVAQRVGRWRTEMDGADVEAVEGAAGDLLEQLGYPLAPPRARAPDD